MNTWYQLFKALSDFYDTEYLHGKRGGTQYHYEPGLQATVDDREQVTIKGLVFDCETVQFEEV